MSNPQLGADSPSPTEVTANALDSAPLHPPPSDSAPPPTADPIRSTSTPLPAKSYHERETTSGGGRSNLPPLYAPNSSVPKFIRLLATLLFLGGTISATVAWFYKSIVVPRLILALKAKTKLFGFHETKYLQLWQGLKQFTESESVTKLGGKEAIQFRKEQLLEQQSDSLRDSTTDSGTAVEHDEGKTPLLSEGEESVVTHSVLPRGAPQLLVPLTTSLRSLKTTISLSTTSAPKKPAFASTNPSNLVQPQGQLMRSFVTFNEYLESESHSISTTVSNPYRTYGTNTLTNGVGAGSNSTVAGGGQERKALQEATQGLKAEIRSIKGALLNRRNFVRPEVGVGA